MKSKPARLVSAVMACGVLLLSGCGSSPSWEEELHNLSKQRQTVQQLYRQGALSSDDYTAKLGAIAQSARTLISLHEEELFKKNLQKLQTYEATAEVKNNLARLTPVESWKVESFWTNRQTDDELLRMWPVVMADMVFTRQRLIENYPAIRMHATSMRLLDLDSQSCRVGVMVSNAVYTVDFGRQGYAWTPTVIHKYQMDSQRLSQE